MMDNSERAALVAEARTFANTLRLALHSAVGSRATIHPARAERAANAFDRLATALEEAATDAAQLDWLATHFVNVRSSDDHGATSVLWWNPGMAKHGWPLSRMIDAARAREAVPDDDVIGLDDDGRTLDEAVDQAEAMIDRQENR